MCTIKTEFDETSLKVENIMDSLQQKESESTEVALSEEEMENLKKNVESTHDAVLSLKESVGEMTEGFKELQKSIQMMFAQVNLLVASSAQKNVAANPKNHAAVLVNPNVVSIPEEIPTELIIFKPQKEPLQCRHGDIFIHRAHYFIEQWLGDCVKTKSSDSEAQREAKTAIKNYHYRSLKDVGANVVDKEILRMQKLGVNWHDQTFSTLPAEHQQKMIEDYALLAKEIDMPVYRCHKNWLAEMMVKYLYRNRRRPSRKRDGPPGMEEASTDTPNKRLREEDESE